MIIIFLIYYLRFLNKNYICIVTFKMKILIKNH